jgi:hypothetical protein
MAKAHRVRLGEGSIVELERKELREWFDKGLIHAESRVQEPGSTEWKRLDQILGAARKQRAGGEDAGGGREPITLERKHFMLIGVVVGVLALVAGVGYFMPEIKSLLGMTEDSQSIRAQASPERRFSEDAQGVVLDVPAGWLLLKPEQDLVPRPPEAQAALGHEADGALGYLTVESPSRGYVTLDDFLAKVVAARRRTNPSVHPSAPVDVPVNGEPGRRAEATWEAGKARFRESVLVTKRGWTYAGLVAWVPEAKGEGLGRASEALLSAVKFNGPMANRLPEAVRRVSEEVPILTPQAAELLMGQSAPLVLEPSDAFRRAFEAVGRGMPALSRTEIQELGTLSTALYNTLPGRDRQRLGTYIERARDRQTTTAAEDEAVARLARTAVLKLPPARRARLQQIYAKAITAAYRTP